MRLLFAILLQNKENQSVQRFETAIDDLIGQIRMRALALTPFSAAGSFVAAVVRAITSMHMIS